MLKLKLYHLFTNVTQESIVSYCKDINSNKYYKVINKGAAGHVEENVEEITRNEFRNKLAIMIHQKNPHEMLVKKIQESFKYSYEDADFYARSLLRKASEYYRQGDKK